MIIRSGSRESGQALILWVVLFVIFVVFILGIATVAVKAIKKICPPDPNGLLLPPPLGSVWQGGIVADSYYTYADPPSNSVSPDATALDGMTTNILIYASPSPTGPWTNLIWTGPIDEVWAAMGSNGIPMENWGTNPPPAQRFYNIEVSLPPWQDYDQLQGRD